MLRIFTSMLMNDIILQFSFTVMILFDFGVKVCWSHKTNWSVPFLSVFWKNLCNTDNYFILKMFGRLSYLGLRIFCFRISVICGCAFLSGRGIGISILASAQCSLLCLRLSLSLAVSNLPLHSFLSLPVVYSRARVSASILV